MPGPVGTVTEKSLYSSGVANGSARRTISARCAIIPAHSLAWYRALHAMPETGFAEYRTAEHVAGVLRGLGLQVISGLGGPGVVGLLRGARADRAAPFVGLRAELDALPMQGPDTGVTLHTAEGPRYHGCGHDGHKATVLTAAAYLAGRPDLAANVAFVFQPAEERLTGAAAMLQAGLLDQVPMSAIFALHNIPGLPKGSVAVAEGAVLASSDGICVTLTAQGDAGNRLYLDLAVCGAVWRDDAVETANNVGAFGGHSGPGRADGANGILADPGHRADFSGAGLRFGLHGDHPDLCAAVRPRGGRAAGLI